MGDNKNINTKIFRGRFSANGDFLYLQSASDRLVSALRRIKPAQYFISFLILASVLYFTGTTSALYSDLEKSFNNEFLAGAIDLQIGQSDIFFNGVASSTAGWDLRDLTIEKFFNYGNLQGGDNGMDTTNIRVNTNPAWVCGNIIITKDEENGAYPPELSHGDIVDDPADRFDGELAQNVSYVSFVDKNSDNIPQTGEIITSGKLADFGTTTGKNLALADSSQNVWTGSGTVSANQIYKIKKIWCLGEFDANYNCNGQEIDNRAQSDITEADFAFYAVQSRHNPAFLCQNIKFPTSTTSTPDSEKFYTCSSVMQQCRMTVPFKDLATCQASLQTTCYTNLSSCQDACDNPLPQRYFACNKTNYSCGQTALFNSKSDCEAITGDVCYTNQPDCLSVCQPPKKKYLTCNTASLSCGDTAQEYISLTDCKNKNGGNCYEDTQTCLQACIPQPKTFVFCYNTDYTCRTTPFFPNKALCEAALHGTCYESSSDCTTNCQRPTNYYYTCNNSNYTCSQTAQKYASAIECRIANGNAMCYDSQSSCENVCQQPKENYFRCDTSANTCVGAGQFASAEACKTATGFDCYAPFSSCYDVCYKPKYYFFECNKTNYSCVRSSVQYESQTACKLATGGDCLDYNTCSTTCKAPTYKYYACDKTNYTCNQTAIGYVSAAVCKSATGKDCYDSTSTCATNCQPPRQQYYTCDNTCYTCSQTANSYTSITDCQWYNPGKKCYATSNDCSFDCRPKFTTTETTGSVYYRWAAQARVGDNTDCWHPAGGMYHETRILTGGGEAAGIHNSWTPYSTYDFTLTHDGNGKVTFNVRNGHAIVSYMPIGLTSNTIILTASAPNCAGAFIEIIDYKKDICSNAFTINRSVLVNNITDVIGSGTKSLIITGSGIDLTKPYVIHGNLRIWWNTMTSTLSPNMPSVTISFN